ncbi:MAG: Fe-S cluster assembly protein SufD [Saprospirales bacterium]|nr:MAG: Fe-S cluster assembly protein SufD [Saprospirales bacterium]
MSKYHIEIPSHFSELFGRLENSLNGQSDKPYHRLRKKGSELLMKQGFPSTRNEDYKYTALNRVFNEKYEIPESGKISAQGKTAIESIKKITQGESSLCFVNGIYQAEFSSLNLEGVQLIQLSQLEENSSKLRDVLEKIDETISHTDNPFIRLNTSLCRDPLLLFVERGVKIDTPIQLIHYYETENSSLIASPQLIIMAEESSEISLLETHLSSSSRNNTCKVFSNVFQRMLVGKNARIKHHKIQELNKEDFLIHNLIASQEKDSHFYAITADLGSRITRNNLEVHLKDSNTWTEMFGLFASNGQQHIDNQTFLDHAKPHCESREWYKGVLGGRSRGVFNGKVLVRQDAQKTNAFQQNNTLLISDNARMDSKPQLEIYADDVKCSHGATIGYMDSEVMFYLKSRGLDEQQAGELIKIAFLAEVFESVENESIRNLIAEKVIVKLRTIYES